MGHTEKPTHIARKIEALLRKTVENGATEEEALQATQKATELLHQYNMSMLDVEMMNLPCGQSDYKIGGKKGHPVELVAVAIGQLTNTEVFKSKKFGDTFVCFFGHPQDRQVAMYLTQIIFETAEREYKQYKKTNAYKQNPAHGKTKRHSFLFGFMQRVYERIQQIIAEKQQAEQSTGTDLLVIKDQIVEQEFERQVGPLKKDYTKKVVRDSSSAVQGAKAGDKVNLNGGIPSNQASAEKQLQ